jgi:hypothetical protein
MKILIRRVLKYSSVKILFIGTILAIAVTLGGCGRDGDGGGSVPVGKLEVFPLAIYLQNPGGLQGNRYKTKAQIDRQLGWKPGVGRLILVQVTSDIGLARKVPFFFPDGVGPGVLPGQKFLMTVLVAEENLVTVENYEKY